MGFLKQGDEIPRSCERSRVEPGLGPLSSRHTESIQRAALEITWCQSEGRGGPGPPFSPQPSRSTSLQPEPRWRWALRTGRALPSRPKPLCGASTASAWTVPHHSRAAHTHLAPRIAEGAAKVPGIGEKDPLLSRAPSQLPSPLPKWPPAFMAAAQDGGCTRWPPPHSPAHPPTRPGPGARRGRHESPRYHALFSGVQEDREGAEGAGCVLTGRRAARQGGTSRR